MAITLVILLGIGHSKVPRQATSSDTRATGDQEGDGWHTSYLSDSQKIRDSKSHFE